MADRLDYKSPLENHPDIVKAIGMVTIESSVLDLMIGRMLGGILGIEEAFSTAIYLTPKSAFARIEMIKNAINEYEENDEIQTIRRVLKRVKAITNKRHAIIHSLYGPGSLSEHAIQIDMPMTTESIRSERTITVNAMNVVIQDMRNLISEIVQITGRLYYDRRASAPLLYTRHIQDRDDPTEKPYFPQKVWTRKA